MLLKFFYFAHGQNVLKYRNLSEFSNLNVQNCFIKEPKIQMENVTLVSSKNLHHENGKKKICIDT